MIGRLRLIKHNKELLYNNIGNGAITPLSTSSCVPLTQPAGPPPKSPVRTIVRAHLGDHGHTFVPTKPGITVRDALSKAMKLRKLVPETCAVYRCSDPSKVTDNYLDLKQYISLTLPYSPPPPQPQS